MKDEFILGKEFTPLDDLYILLKILQEYLGFEINSEDFFIGRHQLYFIFLHETVHAFIKKAANWIYDLNEDETDFIDEVAVRIMIDDILKEYDLFKKVRVFYNSNVNHRKELQYYGFSFKEDDYDNIEKEYYKKYKNEKDIDGFCKYIFEEYKRLDIKREDKKPYI